MVLLGVGLFIVGLTKMEDFHPIKYSADIKYYIVTNGRTVVKHLINGPDDPYIYVWLEDDEGCLEKIMVCVLTKKQCTKVSEEIADLTKDAFLVPYVADEEPIAIVEELEE